MGREGGGGGCGGRAGTAKLSRWLKAVAWGEPYSGLHMPFPRSVLGSLRSSTKTTSRGGTDSFSASPPGQDRVPIGPHSTCPSYTFIGVTLSACLTHWSPVSGRLAAVLWPLLMGVCF